MEMILGMLDITKELLMKLGRAATRNTTDQGPGSPGKNPRAQCFHSGRHGDAVCNSGNGNGAPGPIFLGHEHNAHMAPDRRQLTQVKAAGP